jgi:hypothetical protein
MHRYAVTMDLRTSLRCRDNPHSKVQSTEDHHTGG